MTSSELRNYALRYEPALSLDAAYPPKVRALIKDLVALVAVATLAVGVFDVAGAWAFGVFYISFGVWLLLALIDFLYASRVFPTVAAVLEGHAAATVSFELAEIVYSASEHEVTQGFARARLGRYVLARAGLTRAVIDVVANVRNSGPSIIMSFPDVERIDLAVCAASLFDSDEAFSKILLAHEIDKKDLIGAARWVQSERDEANARARWWSRDELGRIPGLGKDWAYGSAPILMRYAVDLMPSRRTGAKDASKKELDDLERVLARAREANAVIVAEDGSGALELVYGLAESIRRGRAFPSIEHKRVVELDGERLLASAKTKQEFESLYLRVLDDAAAAGNIILVIKDFPGFHRSVRALGSELESVMDRYLASPTVQFIVIADPHGYHDVIDASPTYLERFEKVSHALPAADGLVDALMSEVTLLEGGGNVFFTYTALSEAARGAERYFGEGTPIDKASDILEECVPARRRGQQGYTIVDRAVVASVIERKTGVPTGTVTPVEREKLLNLENLLRARIVGQEPAIEAIANAVRRARGGIANPARPLGSFLFLGPTGVGKTETTKALASVYFGDDGTIVRLDMSEYSGADALEKLIGSYGSGKTGMLTEMLRERPYGVLLLDEFEKSRKEVLDVFLSVIDEGSFTDVRGKKVSAHNVVIIATSNAGSDVIFKLLDEGGDLEVSRDSVIETIVERGVFRPELLNRFDGIILFRPLNNDDLWKIATLMLGKLATRLKDQGTIFSWAPDLVEHLVKIGADRKFGARAMNRAIQDEVERVLADRSIRGELGGGKVIKLSASDLVH